MVEMEYPEVRIAAHGENLGYAEGNNKAAILSSAPYLFFLNNDTHLHPGALASLVAAAERQRQTAIFALCEMSYDGSQTIDPGMGLDFLGFPCSCIDRPAKVFYANGAALFIRRDVFMALGGFDPSYFMFFEETDLCWRARLRGHEITLVPEAIVYHMTGGTAGSSLITDNRYYTKKWKRRYSHRNHLITVYKNFSTLTLCIVLPLLLLTTIIEVLLLITSGQASAIGESYVPAWRDIVQQFPQTHSVRRKIQQSRKVSDLKILRCMRWTPAVVRTFLRVGTPRLT
jgi:GT2 family glycosyltransferase